MKIQESNRGYLRRHITDDSTKNLQKSENLFKLNKSPFRHMGNNEKNTMSGFRKSAFKNFK
jgi:hypothetical protein